MSRKRKSDSLPTDVSNQGKEDTEKKGLTKEQIVMGLSVTAGAALLLISLGLVTTTKEQREAARDVLRQMGYKKVEAITDAGRRLVTSMNDRGQLINRVNELENEKERMKEQYKFELDKAKDKALKDLQKQYDGEVAQIKTQQHQLEKQLRNLERKEGKAEQITMANERTKEMLNRQIASYKEERQDLQQKKKALQTEIKEAVDKEKAKLTEDIRSEFRNMINYKDRKLVKLEDELDDALQKINSLQTKEAKELLRMQSEVQELKDEVALNRKQRRQLRKELVDMEQRMATMKQQYMDTGIAKRELQDQLEEAGEYITRKENELSELQQENAALRYSLQEMQVQIGKLENQTSYLQGFLSGEQNAQQQQKHLQSMMESFFNSYRQLPPAPNASQAEATAFVLQRLGEFETFLQSDQGYSTEQITSIRRDLFREVSSRMPEQYMIPVPPSLTGPVGNPQIASGQYLMPS